jgi:hypothetical protein
MDDDAYSTQSSSHLTMSSGRRNRSATTDNDDLHGAQDGDQDPLVVVPEADDEAGENIVEGSAAPQAAAAVPATAPPPIEPAVANATPDIDGTAALLEELRSEMAHFRTELRASHRGPDRADHAQPTHQQLSIPRAKCEKHSFNVGHRYPNLRSPLNCTVAELEEIYRPGELLNADGGALPFRLTLQSTGTPARSHLDDGYIQTFRHRADLPTSNGSAWKKDLIQYEFLLDSCSRLAVNATQGIFNVVSAELSRQHDPDFWGSESVENAIDALYWCVASYSASANELDLLKLKVTLSVAEANVYAQLHHDNHVQGLHGPIGQLVHETNTARRTARLKFEARAHADKRTTTKGGTNNGSRNDSTVGTTTAGDHGHDGDDTRHTTDRDGWDYNSNADQYPDWRADSGTRDGEDTRHTTDRDGWDYNSNADQYPDWRADSGTRDGEDTRHTTDRDGWDYDSNADQYPNWRADGDTQSDGHNDNYGDQLLPDTDHAHYYAEYDNARDDVADADDESAV